MYHVHRRSNGVADMMANLGALLTPHILISLAIPTVELWDVRHTKRRMMRWLLTEALPLSSRCSKATTMDRLGMPKGRKESKDAEISSLAKWEAYLLAKEMDAVQGISTTSLHIMHDIAHLRCRLVPNPCVPGKLRFLSACEYRIVNASHSVGGAVGYVDKRSECKVAVRKWAEKALNELKEQDLENPQSLRDLLFFLHVPRTGGRTLFQCMLCSEDKIQQVWMATHIMLKIPRFKLAKHGEEAIFITEKMSKIL
eukprot:Gb_16201 [translate_table: standard]